MPLPPTLEVRLIYKKALTPSVCELTFERVDGGSFAFEAGQWVSLVLPASAGELRRAYSIASPPGDTPRFELAVTHVSGGPGSSFLHDIVPGATLKAIGPQGFFTRPIDKAAPSLFIATGTGVTPLRSMMHAALAAQDPHPLWLVFGVRTEEDLLYRQELEFLASEHTNVRVLFTLSRGGESWQGKRGYVQTHVPELWSELEALGLGKPHAYVCGLQKMVGAVRDLLRKQLGVPREQVHGERYD
jgi:ferredoxin-NADP reductase